jgi:23S rRNA (cytosine1962-C5)-methyltransferase
MGFQLHLNKKGVHRVQSKNPWLFTEDLNEKPEGPANGSVMAVLAPDGRTTAWGFLTPEVDTQARIISFGAQRPLLEELVRERIQNAGNLRARFLDPRLLCYRLINSEGDFLPGLVVERYGHILFMESQLGFWKAREDLLGRCVADLWPGTHPVFSWNPASTLHEKINLSEYGIQFEISMGKGQKTGHFCDQRENRLAFGKIFRGDSVLDLFCYSGGFSLAVGKKAKRILAVDNSIPALEWVKHNAQLNGISCIETMRTDINSLQSHPLKEDFDAVICDPPKLVKRRAQKQSGFRMYYRLNLQAMSRVKPGGILMTFSCSGSVSKDEFSGLVAAAARKLDRNLQVISHLSAGPDHPSLAALPETGYLKGLLVRIF